MLLIRKLKKSEIEILKDFPPEDWHFNIVDFLKANYSKPYFEVVAAEVDNKIAGTGNVFIQGETAWLGNIIVHQEFRKRGIGKAVTEKLMNISEANNCKSILLVASRDGEKLYPKLGFKISSYYEFYKNERILDLGTSESIVKNAARYYSQVNKLDKKISGEVRSDFLKAYFSNSFVFKNLSNNIEGFYLPGCGRGLIIAENDKAGIELLKLRCKENRFNTVIPEQNESAKRFLLENGFELYNKAPRMYFGSEVNWKPEMIFSRGSGYAG